MPRPRPHEFRLRSRSERRSATISGRACRLWVIALAWMIDCPVQPVMWNESDATLFTFRIARGAKKDDQ
jgi:hypothetical protein